jgi:hypothetical protein
LKVQYCVRAQAIEQDGKKYALIEIVDENVSRPCEQPPETRVRINPAGKARALADLLQKPLVGPPELGHDATQVVGHAVDFTSNHATRVLYEIPDLAAWAKIESGEWGAVSPRMTPLKAHYEGDVFVLDEWTWDDVAFVPAGAFPNAGVKSTCIGDPRLCGFTAQKPCGFSYAVAAAAADLSKSRLKAQRSRTETDVSSTLQEPGRQEARTQIGGHPEGGVIVKNTEKEAIPSTVLAADAWNTADAPDEFFAYVPDSAKGPDGRKSDRGIPLASIQKKDLDEAIIRDAVSRLPQATTIPDSAKAGVLRKICRVASKLGLKLPSCEGVSAAVGFSKEVDACMTPCDHEKVIAELTDKNTKLDAVAKDLKAKATELTERNTKLEAELKELKAKPPAPVAASDVMVAVQAELKAVKAEYEALKAWKVAAEEADHMKRVQDVVDLRIKNGVLDPKNVQTAVDSLKKLPNDALDAMKADLEAVKGKFDSLPSGPKARLIPSVAARFDPMQPTVGDLVGKKPGEK